MTDCSQAAQELVASKAREKLAALLLNVPDEVATMNAADKAVTWWFVEVRPVLRELWSAKGTSGTISSLETEFEAHARHLAQYANDLLMVGTYMLYFLRPVTIH